MAEKAPKDEKAPADPTPTPTANEGGDDEDKEAGRTYKKK